MSRYVAPNDSNLYYAVRHFYYFAIISSYSAQFSLTLIDQNTFRSNFYCLIAPMTTYLKDLTRSVGRYGGISKNEFGFGFLDAQVVSLLSVEFFASKDIEQAPHVEGSMTI